MVYVNIDSKEMNELLSKAIMSSLDESKRDILIKAALDHLVTRDNSYYGGRKSPIEDAFQSAVQKVATQIAEQLVVGNAEVMEKMRSLVNEALLRLTETNREQTVTRLADVITQAMWSRS